MSVVLDLSWDAVLLSVSPGRGEGEDLMFDGPRSFT